MDRECEDPQDAGQLEGRYVNYFQVGHNAFELLLESSQLYRESEKAHFHIRIIAGPVYAKALLERMFTS